MRSPVKIDGNAAGKSNLRNRVVRLTLFRVKRSWWPLSTDFNPKRKLVRMGKMATKTHVTMRAVRVGPNHTEKSGTSAKMGTVWSATA